MQAAKKGKAVFCEKQVDLDIASIVKVQKVLEENNAVFQIGFDKNFKKYLN